MRRILTIAAALAFVVGCTKDIQVDPVNDAVEQVAKFTLTVDVESATRLGSTIDREDVDTYNFEAGDELRLCRIEEGAFTGKTYPLTLATGTSNQFESTEAVADGDYAVYYVNNWSLCHMPTAKAPFEYNIPQYQKQSEITDYADYVLLQGDMSVQGGESASAVTLDHKLAILEFRIAGSNEVRNIRLHSVDDKNTFCSWVAIAADGTLSKSGAIKNVFVQPFSGSANEGGMNYVRMAIWLNDDDVQNTDIEIDVLSADAEGNIYEHETKVLPKRSALVAGATTPISFTLDEGVKLAQEPKIDMATKSIEIATADQLRYLYVATDHCMHDGFEGYQIKQTADLDMTGDAFRPIGYGMMSFHGSYDGQYYDITNLTINQSADVQTDFQKFGAALFATAIGANPEKPSVIENVVLRSGSITGYRLAAGICAHAKHVQIVNCYNGANITVSSNDAKNYPLAAGVVGFVSPVTLVAASINAGNIKANGANGTSVVGGVVGRVNTDKEIESETTMVVDCINMGDVHGNADDVLGKFCGAIIGVNNNNSGQLNGRQIVAGCLNWGQDTATQLSNVKGNSPGYTAGASAIKANADKTVEGARRLIRSCYSLKNNAQEQKVIGTGVNNSVDCGVFGAGLKPTVESEGWVVEPNYWMEKWWGAWESYWKQDTFVGVDIATIKKERPTLLWEAEMK